MPYIELIFEDETGQRTVICRHDLGTEPATKTVGIRTTVLNVRQKPTVSAPIVGKLYLGSNVNVFEGKIPGDGYQWYRIADGAGFIASEFTGAEFGGGGSLIVPWRTQFIGRLNACGQTCVGMIGDYYLDSFPSTNILYNQEPGLTTGAELERLANRNGIVVDSFSANLDTIAALIESGKPPIVLVKEYRLLNTNNPHAGDGKFAHWIVVTSIADDVATINDPLWLVSDRNGLGGRDIQIKLSDLDAALWRGVFNVVA